jgi:putative ABC transport system permease protein
MKPEAPVLFGRTLLDRAGLYRLFSPAMRMVAREIERRPVRMLLSGGSVALATAIVVIGGVSTDSINEVLRLEYDVVERHDLAVTLNQAVSARATRELEHVPGVLFAEGERTVAVRLHTPRHEKTTMLVGINKGRQLHGLRDANRRPLSVPPTGVALSRPLGNLLALRAGDTVDVESLEPGGRNLRLEVTAIVDDLVGLYAYMDGDELQRALREAPSVNRILLAVDRLELDDVQMRLEAIPGVAAVSRPDMDRDLFRAEVAESYLVMQLMLALFASAIAVGVVYNNARIALEMRSRDLATLRILGFTRAELAVVLLGEQVVQLVLGVWPGLLLGKWLGGKMLGTIDPELMRVPVTLSPASQLMAAAVVILAAIVSALRVRTRSDRLDLVAVLKARD